MKNKKIIISIILTNLLIIIIGSIFCILKTNKKIDIEKIKKSIVQVIPESKLISYENNPGGILGNEINFGIGTGFFINKDGTIITANHIVNDKNNKYIVITNENKKYEAKIILNDEKNDIAKLKINSENKFIPLKISKKEVNIGDKIISFGTDSNNLNTINISGKITAKKIKLDNISNLIEFSPSVKPGFSGGPIINDYGEVIGINHSIKNGKSYAVMIK